MFIYSTLPFFTRRWELSNSTSWASQLPRITNDFFLWYLSWKYFKIVAEKVSYIHAEQSIIGTTMLWRIRFNLVIGNGHCATKGPLCSSAAARCVASNIHTLIIYRAYRFRHVHQTVTNTSIFCDCDHVPAAYKIGLWITLINTSIYLVEGFIRTLNNNNRFL